MDILRTPDHCFDGLPDYPFKPHYATITDADSGADMRVHYVDDGPRDGAVVLLLHGEPSWSFLYRKMIPVLTKAGYRVLAPDLIGFGKSDKIKDRTHYTYARHLAWLTDWLDGIGVSDVTLFCQDWGGLLGLRLVAAQPDLFASVVTSNTFLPTGAGKPADAFLQWQTFSQTVPVFPTGKIIQGATVSTLTDDEVAAYNAPYPDEDYKAGARQFPTLVPTSLDDPESQNNMAAWDVLRQFDRPWLCLFGDSDPITAGGDKYITAQIPGCQNQPHQIIKQGGHFIQEDKGEELAGLMVEWMKLCNYGK